MLLHLSTHHQHSTRNNNDYDEMTLASGLGGYGGVGRKWKIEN